MEQYLKLYKTSNEYYEDSNKPVMPHIIDIVSFNPEPPVVNPCEIDTMCPVVSPENIYVDYKGEEIRLNYDLGECWRLKDVIDSSQCAYYDRTRTLFVYQNDEGREREFNVKFVFANKSTGLECQSIVNVIQYANPVIDPFNGHEYVDLGLPSGALWAKMNVGANTDSEFGKYYQWGATEEYRNENQYYTGQTLTKERDIVSISMGGSWVTPSKEDFEELIANTNKSLQSTPIGYIMKFINKNDLTKYIFFPFAGFYSNGDNVMKGGGAYMWTNEKSVALDVYYNDITVNSNFCKECGLSVRGVVKL